MKFRQIAVFLSIALFVSLGAHAKGKKRRPSSDNIGGRTYNCDTPDGGIGPFYVRNDGTSTKAQIISYKPDPSDQDEMHSFIVTLKWGANGKTYRNVVCQPTDFSN